MVARVTLASLKNDDDLSHNNSMAGASVATVLRNLQSLTPITNENIHAAVDACLAEDDVAGNCPYSTCDCGV